MAADAAFLEVDNPYWSPSAPEQHRRIVAPRTLRDDPLGQMHDRHQVSEYQYRAGRLWQADYEAAGIGRIKSQDTTIEPVDGGGRLQDGITDRQVRAMKRLDRWRKMLGSDGWRLTVTVLGDKRSVREATQHLFGEASPANVKYAGRRFRECLDSLAFDLGLSNA